MSRFNFHIILYHNPCYIVIKKPLMPMISNVHCNVNITMSPCQELQDHEGLRRQPVLAGAAARAGRDCAQVRGDVLPVARLHGDQARAGRGQGHAAEVSSQEAGGWRLGSDAVILQEAAGLGPGRGGLRRR